MTIKQLKQLDFERKKAKYPHMAEHCIPVYPYKQNNANSLTRCIVDYVNFTGHFAVRINNGGTFRKGKSFKTVVGNTVKMKDTYTFNGTRGVADIDAIKTKVIDETKQTAIPVKIEVKFGKDKMSKHQAEMKQRVESTGAIYLIAKDFESFCLDWNNI